MKKITLLTTLCLTLLANASQVCNENIVATAPANHFTVNADNTVTDNTTGLTWMRCSLGQTGSDCSGGSAAKYTWAGALNEVAKNHSGWRLPNIKELGSIVELKCYNPSVDITIFPNTIFSGYWSSSPSASGHYAAWNIFFDSGYEYGHEYGNGRSSKDNSYYVRLVRNGL